MTEMYTAIVVGRNRDTATSIIDRLEKIEWLRSGSHIASNGHANLLKGLESLPDILIVDLSHLWKEELDALNQLPLEDRPHIIVVDSNLNAESMRSAMQIGARDYFTHPIDANGFEQALDKISNERIHIKDRKNAKLISFINGKGGSGATMLCSNLAYILAQKHDKRVALLDLHCNITSLPLYFDINVNHTIIDVLTNIDSLDELGLESSMMKYSDQLHILTSKKSILGGTIRIGESSIKKLIELASKAYDFVVVDLPTDFDIASSCVLHHSEKIFLVTQQSIPHVSESGLVFSYLTKEVGVSKEKINVIVNRYNAKDAIRIEDIRNSHCDSIITVPSDYKSVTYSLNVGRPLFESFKRGAVTKSLLSIANGLVKSQSGSRGKNWSKSIGNLFGS